MSQLFDWVSMAPATAIGVLVVAPYVFLTTKWVRSRRKPVSIKKVQPLGSAQQTLLDAAVQAHIDHTLSHSVKFYGDQHLAAVSARFWNLTHLAGSEIDPAHYQNDIKKALQDRGIL
jgi:hypothetical protein